MIRFRSSWRWLGAALALMVMVGCEDDVTPTSPADELSPTTVTAKALAAGTTVITPADVSPTDGAWHPANEQGGGASVISTAQPDQDGGAGSLDQSLPAPTSSSPKTDFQILTEDEGGFGLLGDLDELRFDWYRASSSTAPNHLTPAFRLYVFDPDHGSEGASYLLVWEGIYNGYPAASGPVPTDAWIREDILAGNFWRIPQLIDGVWMGFGGCDQTGSVTDPTDPSACFVFDRGLGDWTLGENTVVVGVNVGLGSGWNGTYQSYADLVTVGFNGASTTWDFEPGDEQPPVVLNVAAEPVAIGATGAVTATVDDTGTGNSAIASAALIFDGGSAIAMTADDGSFNNPVEDVTGTFTAPGEPGLYEACVTGTDAGGNTSAAECITVAVYDPSGGFVTGGGWINSPEGAMPPVVSLATISGVSGVTSEDPDATYAPYMLRYIGSSSPLGWDPEHDYQWGDPSIITPSPEDGPVVMEGTIDIDEQVEGQVAMIGLLDRDALASGIHSFQRGAYIYVHRSSATSWRIGVTDGNDDGEIVQAFTTVADTDLPADGVLSVIFTVDGTADGSTCAAGPFTTPAGCMTLNISGGSVNATVSDSYGDLAAGSSANPEFANGAVPGWDDYLGSNVGYELSVPAVSSPSPEGKATFGFVAKYKKGANAPDGNTQFTFKDGDLDFHSTSYDWLVVNQNDSNAQFKGEGTVNGEPGYSFMLWAGDHDGGDTFRIQITGPGGLVYDNGSDQVIGGGSIIVHSGKGKK